MNEPRFWSARAAANDIALARAKSAYCAALRSDIVLSARQITRLRTTRSTKSRLASYGGCSNYTPVQGLSIGAIARLLNEQAIPTCKRRGRWERSTVWGMLRNPAYKGQACFGKTTLAPRQRITRPIRMRGGIATRNSASHEQPRGDWITIAVPPIVSEEAFALAQERLETNKTHAPRRTVTPRVVQGLVSCAKCGYALYRPSPRSSARAIHYYRCLGSDA